MCRGIEKRCTEFYRYELKNFRGDVRQVINDVKSRENINGTIEYTANVIQSSDSYPFGWDIKERSFSTDLYRFAFNGQEKSPEISNGHQTAKFWEYDSRIARRWNLDPRPVTSFSPYSVFGGNPIFNTDVKGDSAVAPSRDDMQRIADDLNRVYKTKYGEEGAKAFSVQKIKRVRDDIKAPDDYRNFWGYLWWSNTQSVEVTEYALVANPNFDWNKDKYTKAMFDIISFRGYVWTQLEADVNKSLIDGKAGGYTETHGWIRLSTHLGTYRGRGSSLRTLGTLFMHEALYHVHPLGDEEEKLKGSSELMRDYYGSQRGVNPHGSGSDKHPVLRTSEEKKWLDDKRSKTPLKKTKKK
ncbi:hypothetical protein [Aureispira anguillae]|uniref:RHS repeat-associated core domain-containing protein n=1 Tax=Aureispira anguillae TaxID=2864201 RepID=A0A915YCQ8_9BACT|nr:hypothetical protein [Aureispira anguillae]BDS10668.1 hypothetical protein AsAng_0013770 [Aureispira anguillae]